MSARMCCRALSPSLKKMCSPPLGAPYHTSAVSHSQADSSSTKTSTKTPSEPAKSKTSSNQESASVGNNTYVSGPTFFSHNEYSFYDFELDMEKDRIVQPSSEKIKLHCKDKLNPPVARDLLPNPFGQLVQWPGMAGYQVGPVTPTVHGKYRVSEDGEERREGQCNYGKIPL